jgi:hypothetical protein
MKRTIRLLLGLGLVASVAPGAAASAILAPPLPARIDLPDGWAPEGITAGRDSTVYVGSLATGAVWRGDVRTGTGSVLVPGGSPPAVGVEFDRGSHRIWVAGGPTGMVRAYDAGSGALLQTYQFSPAGFLNDLVVTRNAVYATDSMVQQLAVIPLGRGGALPRSSAAFALPLSGAIQFVPGQFNANGIVASGRWLLLVQSNTGQLFRVDPRTGIADRVDLGGASVTFGDGLELHGKILYVVRNQLEQVTVFRVHGSLGSARLLGSLTSPDLDVPTTAAFAVDHLWAVNARFGTPVTPTTEYWITRLPAR